MGTFQVVYDDFSGGQYMGPKATNLPKNTWKGNDVICNPSGELIPTGTKRVINFTDASGANVDGLLDHWVVGDYGYVFIYNANTLPVTYRLIRYQHTNGTAFPVTPNAYSLTMPGGYSMGSTMAYSSVTERFYYVTRAVTPISSVYRVSTTGTNNTAMTGTISAFLEGVVAYGLRLVAWSTLNNRLYYTGSWSGTDFGAWSNTQYYEFESRIRMVFARTEDLLVICDYGVYSLTGVLGSGVTIQLIVPGSSLSDGMQFGDVVNRSLYHLDVASPGQSFGPSGGAPDGRLHQLIGATSRAVASFELGDYGFNPNGYSTIDPGRVNGLPGSRMSVVFKNGWSYFEVTPGVFGRSKIHNITVPNNTYRYRPGKTGPQAPNEYMLTAFLNNGLIDVYRTFTNVVEPTFLDANFSNSTSSTCTDEPVGTVELSEYWHQKPFTVKEMFIEYSAAASGSVSAYIEPTGVVDVAAATLPSVVSNTVTDANPPVGSYRMYRYWPNNASKGFGMKPILTITNCSIKRVIVNCED